MNLFKYKQLKTKIRDKSFEVNFKGLDKGLFLLSFLGNAGAIFFAFFLLNPALQKTITQHLSNSILFQIIGVLLSIAILVGVEYVKRNVFRIFSAEFIQNTFKLFKPAVLSLLIFSIIIFGASFYFSITGGIQFSKLSDNKNEIVLKSNKQLFDSLTIISENSKKPILVEIENLRESNKNLRDRRDNTPLEYRSARIEYDKLIDKNEKSIIGKQEELNSIDRILELKINDLKKGEKTIITSNKDADFGSILLFLIISTGSELLIIIGIYFRELYEHKSFYEVENKLEPALKKKEKYEYLLKIVYKNGEVLADDPVISLNKLIEVMKSKGTQYPSKIINEFYLELTHLGIFKVMSNKRYALISYGDAKKLIEGLQV